MLSQLAASLPAQGEMHSPAMEQGRQAGSSVLGSWPRWLIAGV